jgi:acetylornithine/succinyldiaminopimelate/putrescine aminotransferase
MAAVATSTHGTGRAFHRDQFGPFCRELAQLTGTEMVLPANSGAEAVESAVKIATKWAYQVKGVPDGVAEICGRGLWAARRSPRGGDRLRRRRNRRSAGMTEAAH